MRKKLAYLTQHSLHLISDNEEEAGLVDVRLASIEDDDDSAGLSASSSYPFQLQFISDKEEPVSGTASSIRALAEYGTSS